MSTIGASELLKLEMQVKTAEREVERHKGLIRQLFDKGDNEGAKSAALDLVSAKAEVTSLRAHMSTVRSMQTKIRAAEQAVMMTQLNQKMARQIEQATRRMNPDRMEQTNERLKQAQEDMDEAVKEMHKVVAPPRAQRRAANDMVAALEDVLGLERAQRLVAPPSHLPGTLLPEAPSRTPIVDTLNVEEDFADRLFKP